MHDGVTVINTTPLIALSAAGCMDALGVLYQQVVVPREVADEMRAGILRAVGIRELADTRCLDIQTDHTDIPAYLSHVLDRGEAAVIATALVRTGSVLDFVLRRGRPQNAVTEPVSSARRIFDTRVYPPFKRRTPAARAPVSR